MQFDFEDDDSFNETLAIATTNDPKPSGNSVDRQVVERMLAELSDEQREAAIKTTRNALLLAPAGTGKTRVMTTRFVHLASSGVPVERLLMCTFTNAAANELLDRVTPAIYGDCDNLWVGTTHAIGLRIIREHAAELNLFNVDTIMDRQQQEEVVTKLMYSTEHPMAGTPNQKPTIDRILDFIEEAKNAMKSPEEAVDAIDAGDVDWARGVSFEDARVYTEYERFKLAYCMIDYNDMLYLPTRLIETNEEIAETWRGMFAHVLVDEYQDLSRSQIRLLKNIVGTGNDAACFYAAADDDQSIYGWRGSDVRATIDFQRYWNEADILQIRDNYRTPKAIFSHASRLIRHNTDRHAKNIRTARDPDALVRSLQKQDEAAEKQAVLENILEGCRRFDIPFERVAILCRSNRMCQEFASFFAAKDVPVNLHESIRLSAEPIRALVNWMQISTKADNPLMYEQIAIYPEVYLPEAAMIDHAARLQKRHNKQPNGPKIGPIAMLLEMHGRGKTTSGSAALAEKIVEVRAFLENPPSAPFAALADHLGITEKVANSTRSEDHQLPAFLRLADEMVGQIGLTKTLASLTQLDLNAGKDGINITTMHGAKGLEFDIVALPGWEEGEFPNATRRNPNDISEERRLAYVALTRPKKMLIVSWSGRDGRQRRPSRFLTEAGIIQS
ncbi:ATP-dependent helicase [Croceicoccus gelatinilyticus]|uniref:ATP-dependent helicase n=1 Tax=Croceicoccus gelatinilyticus TaxID=2835536 RepID=UPI001BCF762B|nr:ATP-dependent helicase [Croceicoccus gelatinilyticus]MBS7671553.1 ATP-dependent helicase [Croceicoccus gelatinilyticus]